MRRLLIAAASLALLAGCGDDPAETGPLAAAADRTANEESAAELHWATGSLPRPVVIRLVAYVRIPRDTHKRKITRRAVFARDGWSCQYCGARTSLTVDHVIPRSKGGDSTWDNIVASCAPCNRRKGDRLPHQANMHPRVKPRMPSPQIFIQLASPTIPATWRQYLLHEVHEAA